MGVIEKNIAITSKDAEGNQLLYYPFTKVDNVDGAVSETQLKNYATKQEIPTQYLKDVTVLNDKLTFSTNNLPKTVTVNNVAYAKQAGNMFWDGILDKPTIPTKTSDLSNDNNFITSSELEPYALTETVNSALMGKVDYGTLNNYVTKIELNNKGYLTSIPAEYVTETELNEKNFITEIDLIPYAKTDIVNQQLNQKVNTSEMINYVTYTSLSKQGFLTKDDLDSEIVSISNSEIDNLIGG